MRSSSKLRLLLQQVLQIGNYLNGASSRGGAAGFRLSDLEKLSLVKSADLRSTLLHYIARLPCASDLHEFKELQRILKAAANFGLAEMKPELASIRRQFEMVEKTSDTAASAEPRHACLCFAQVTPAPTLALTPTAPGGSPRWPLRDRYVTVTGASLRGAKDGFVSESPSHRNRHPSKDYPDNAMGADVSPPLSIP